MNRKSLLSLITKRRISVGSNSNVRSTASSGSKVYDSKRAVHEYLLAHYGKPKEIMPYEFNEKDSFKNLQKD